MTSALLRRASCTVVTLAVMFAALPAIADELPTAEQIRAHVIAAAGAPLDTYRETVDASASGLHLRTTVLHSGKDFRETTDEGPVHTAEGSFHGQRWRQNENGETILIAPAPGLAVRDTYRSSVERIATPIDGYLVSFLNAVGDGTKRYVEATTWHVVREDVVRPSGTTVTTYDDFRTVAGHTFAFHESSKDGHPENDRDQRIAAVDADPVAESELAIPPSSRTLVEFPNGKSVVELPVRLDRGKFIVRAMVGNRGLDFVLDTGASGILLEDGIAGSLGLTKFGSVSESSAGRFRSASTIVPQMSVGELTMRNVFVRTAPSIGVAGFTGEYRAVGLLGFDFIDAIGLKLNYYDGTATAYDPATFVAPDARKRFDLDLRLGGGVPFVTVKVNGAIGERFVLDTGAYGALLLFEPFERRNPGALVDEGGGGGDRDIHLAGIGGAIPFKPYQLNLVQVGPIAFHDFLAYGVTERGVYADGSDGVVGPDLLRAFDVFFDYAHAKAYLVSNEEGQPAPAR